MEAFLLFALALFYVAVSSGQSSNKRELSKTANADDRSPWDSKANT